MELFPAETSLAVDPILYEGDEQFLSQFKPRIYKDPTICDDACLQAQLDLLGAEHSSEVIGSLDKTIGSAPALAFPFCKPDRMPLLSYILEVGFLLDDLGNLDPTELPTVKQFLARGARVLPKLAEQVQAFHLKFGRALLHQWKNWKITDAKIQTRNNTQHETISAFVIILVQFVTEIELTSEEDATLVSLHFTLCAAFSLHNDYYSWEKEYTAFTGSNGHVPCLNGVYVYMDSEGLSAKAALDGTRKKSVELENEYRGLWGALEGCSSSVDCWLDVLEAVTAGTMLWSISCPRYRCVDGAENLYRSYYNERLEAGVRPHVFTE